MSIDKSIAAGAEHRRPYYRSGRFDRSCRPGGDCPWCRGARTVADRRRAAAAHEQQREHRDREPDR